MLEKTYIKLKKYYSKRLKTFQDEYKKTIMTEEVRKSKCLGLMRMLSIIEICKDKPLNCMIKFVIVQKNLWDEEKESYPNENKNLIGTQLIEFKNAIYMLKDIKSKEI